MPVTEYLERIMFRYVTTMPAQVEVPVLATACNAIFSVQSLKDPIHSKIYDYLSTEEQSAP